MKINTDLLNIHYINNKELPSMPIVYDMFHDIENRHSNAFLIQRGRGKYSYKMKSEKQTFFLKIWKSSGLKEQIKHSIKADNSIQEYNNTIHLKSLHIRVPEIFFFASIREKGVITDIQITEFINTDMTAFQYIKDTCSSNELKKTICFSDKILVLTNEILGAGVIDPDHRLKNIMVNENYDPVKIDLEIAFKKTRFTLNRKNKCKMLGTLIYSYVFAVQPNLELASKFTDNLYNIFDLNYASKKEINKIVMAALDKQLRETGIDSRFDLLI